MVLHKMSIVSQNQANKNHVRNRKKKERKKRAKLEKRIKGSSFGNIYNNDDDDDGSEYNKRNDNENHIDESIEIEYINDDEPDELSDPLFRQYKKVFDKFKSVAGLLNGEADANAPTGYVKKAIASEFEEINIESMPLKARAALLAQQSRGDDDDAAKGNNAFKGFNGTEEDTSKMSKKKLKKMTRLSVAALKQLVSRPDVVEMYDVCARDPKLLIHLKSYRNTVPVPRHWCAKRKYLQGKRGIEKSTFRLPEYIVATGIVDMRDNVHDKDTDKSLKSKMREKVRPKVGKVDIDYNKLHDAFFKYQTKPFLTGHGDLYYEGKEFEVRMREKKPGTFSDELKTSLGMPVGTNSDRFPPPWLIAMQRYGPPPSYPNLKIPGLNSRIPDGCSFGYHTGGWGKPPVDATGKPLYGDVFGHGLAAHLTREGFDEKLLVDNGISKKYWGELESDDESESDDEEVESSEDEDDEIDKDQAEGLVTPATGLVTPSGFNSIAGGFSSSVGGGVSISGLGLETPQSIELRKKQQLLQTQQVSTTSDSASIKGSIFQAGEATPQLYKVLPEVETSIKQGDLLGSNKIYNVNSETTSNANGASNTSVQDSKTSDKKVSLSKESTSKKRKNDSSGSGNESGRQSSSGGSDKKKYKDFKF